MSDPYGPIEQANRPANHRAQPRRRLWIIGIVLVAAVLVGGTFAATSLLVGDSATGDEASTPPATSSTTEAPEPITRAELLEEYALILPGDTGATPEGIDGVAQQACDLLDSGSTTDELITAVNHIYQANSTKVMQLFVSYRCPEHLDDFK